MTAIRRRLPAGSTATVSFALTTGLGGGRSGGGNVSCAAGEGQVQLSSSKSSPDGPLVEHESSFVPPSPSSLLAASPRSSPAPPTAISTYSAELLSTSSSESPWASASSASSASISSSSSLFSSASSCTTRVRNSIGRLIVRAYYIPGHSRKHRNLLRPRPRRPQRNPSHQLSRQPAVLYVSAHPLKLWQHNRQTIEPQGRQSRRRTKYAAIKREKTAKTFKTSKSTTKSNITLTKAGVPKKPKEPCPFSQPPQARLCISDGKRLE